MTVALVDNDNFMSKLVSILDTAKLKQKRNIVILVDKKHHNDVFESLKGTKSVGSIKMGGQTFFIIKEMRIEVKPIDFYI